MRIDSIQSNLVTGSLIVSSSLTLSGSIALSGSLILNSSGSITGSLFGTASFALSSSVKPHIYVRRLGASQAGVTTGTNLIFNSNPVSGSIGYNTSTGVFSLIGGNTYLINASLEFDVFSNGTAGFMLAEWTDSTTNTAIGLNPAHAVPATFTGTTSATGVMTGIYRPASNQSIVLRIVAATGTAELRFSSGVTIVQL